MLAKTCYNAIIYTEQKEGEIKNLFLEYFYFNFATLSILLVLVVFMLPVLQRALSFADWLITFIFRRYISRN